MDLPFDVTAEHHFYGVDNTHFKLGAQVYQAVEDEDDGYRSCLQEIEVVSKADVEARNLVFPKRPVDTVRVVTDEDFTSLISTRDGHVWLKFGTDVSDDYYPVFIFQYEVRS